MRILRVISGMNPRFGGPSQGIRNSIPELEKLGVSNEVVSLDDPNDSFLNNSHFKIHAIGKGKGPWAYNSALIPWLVDNFNRFDVVLVHGLWLFQTYAVYKAFKIFSKKNSKRLKVFVIPHGMLDPYFQKVEGRKLKAIRNWLYWKFIEGKVINNAHGVLFTCEEEMILARQTFIPYHPKREINVGYGIADPPAYSVDMERAFLDICPEVENQSYILFLSRVHPKKGIDMLINAYKETFPEYPAGSMPKLVIAGPGLDNAFGQSLKGLAADYSDYIFFTGMLTGAAKWGALYGCDVFILPSHQENFGIAIVEALACKRAVLISNKINIWREIESCDAGMIDGDTLDGTKTLLKRWLDLSVDEQKLKCENARHCYEKYFKTEPAAKRLFSALKDI